MILLFQNCMIVFLPRTFNMQYNCVCVYIYIYIYIYIYYRYYYMCILLLLLYDYIICMYWRNSNGTEHPCALLPSKDRALEVCSLKGVGHTVAKSGYTQLWASFFVKLCENMPGCVFLGLFKKYMVAC